ncbi:phasin family protein [Hyphomonas sp.]|uniref:phasin family protein n=1 Tax=Hyphomonas sp. TaxID=87 RepID=UPI001D91BAA4|nr:phasin family protein [Hyphomonas sp.]MBU3921214.1 phasin family protein [Alphaproteobacteria bacterium]MBU4061216.1 phasin family protein [Alphaproteobacteria bacterium]MBU4165128.1 phasin family protein [Alphaproteobacteria bacterium]
MAKKTTKTSTRAKAAAVGKQVEAQSTEMAYKIWLAGVGAYGKAYDTAMAGANVLNKQSADVFDDLVKRGAEIEHDVRARLAADERVSGASKQVHKTLETVRDMQTQARDQFEARLDRMRGLLGVKNFGTVRDTVARQIDKLEDEVAAVTSKARATVGDVDLKARLARLTAEIEAVAGETGADVAKTAKKAARKTSKAMKAAFAAPEAADDLTQADGIGPALAKKLHAEGLTRFSQLAALKKGELEALDTKVTGRGRVAKAAWAKLAKAAV